MKKKGISEIEVRDSKAENLAEIAEHFNSHFCSVRAELNSKMPSSIGTPLFYMGQSSDTSFNAGPASDIEGELIIGGG